MACAVAARTPQGIVAAASRSEIERCRLRTDGFRSGNWSPVVRLGQIPAEEQAMKALGTIGLEHLQVIRGLGIRLDQLDLTPGARGRNLLA